MHPIAILLGYFFGGTIISALALTALGYEPGGRFRPNYIFMFICGCIGAGIAQTIAEKMAKKKKQLEVKESFKQKDFSKKKNINHSDFFMGRR